MSRFPHVCTRAFILSVLVSLLPVHVQAEIKYGLWAITIQSSMEAMPTEIPPETIKKCIRKDDLTPGSNKANDGCKPVKANRKGDTVSWKVSCAMDDHSLKGQGKITYKGDTMKGSGNFQAGGKGLPNVKLKLVYTGKRLGECRD